MKHFFYILKNQQGSLAGILVAVGFLGVSTAGLLQYMTSTSNMIQGKISQDEVALDIHSTVIQNMRSLLIESKVNQNGKEGQRSVYGACSFVAPVMKRHGVAQVQFKFPSLSSTLTGLKKQSFSTQRWQNFFSLSDYTLLTNTKPCQKIDPQFKSHYFSKCFQYTGQSAQTGDQVYFIARIVPKKFPNFAKIDLSKSSTLDVKKVIFELQVLVSIVNTDLSADSTSAQQKVRSSQYVVLMWGSDITECHAQTRNGEWAVVQFSGTGTGRISRDKLVINHSEFKPPKKCSEVQFTELSQDVIMGGQYSANKRNSIEADYSKNARIACQKRVYRCPNERSQNTDYINDIPFFAGIYNDNGGALRLNKLQMTVVNKSGKEIDSTNNGQLDKFNITAVNEAGGSRFSVNQVLSSPQNLNVGANRFNFSLQQAQTSNALSNLCTQVCDNKASYYPLLSMSFTKPPSAGCSYSKDYSQGDKKDQYRFRCKVCHSKMCYTGGLGAFGPLETQSGGFQGLKDEPLDGTFPECALKKTNLNYRPPTVYSGAGNCVALKVNKKEDLKNFASAKYSFQNCSSSLPVLCFAHGHYLPAITISSSGQWRLFEGRFNSAERACYEMGRERVSKDSLASFLAGFKNPATGKAPSDMLNLVNALNIPARGNYFYYVNNATRGLFITPTYNVKVTPLLVSPQSSSLQEYGPYNSYIKQVLKRGKMWTATKKDADSWIIGAIPRADIATSAVSVYMQKGSVQPGSVVVPRPLVLKDRSSITSSTATNTGFVLTHNIRYKGVFEKSIKAYTKHRALCRKGLGRFVLTNSVKLSQAPKACRDKGAWFVPPISSLEWVKALSLVNQNDEMYPFPNPGGQAGFSHHCGFGRSLNCVHKSVPSPKVWVALDKGERVKLHGSKFPKQSASSPCTRRSLFTMDNFSVEKFCKNKALYSGVIDYYGKADNISELDLQNWNWRNEKYRKYRKACVSNSKTAQSYILSMVPGDRSCPSGKRAMTEKTLKTQIKSLVFMSEWVKKESNWKNYKFVISETLQKRIKRARCKGDCETRRKRCAKRCCRDRFYTCRNSCRDNPATPYINERRDCIRACRAANTRCISHPPHSISPCIAECNNRKNTCTNRCDERFPL